MIKNICALDPRVIGLRLRRNFGQTSALAAGFDHAAGEIIVAMDGDLQHQPEDIPRFLKKLEKGFEPSLFWVGCSFWDWVFWRPFCHAPERRNIYNVAQVFRSELPQAPVVKK